MDTVTLFVKQFRETIYSIIKERYPDDTTVKDVPIELWSVRTFGKYIWRDDELFDWYIQWGKEYFENINS